MVATNSGVENDARPFQANLRCSHQCVLQSIGNSSFVDCAREALARTRHLQTAASPAATDEVQGKPGERQSPGIVAMVASSSGRNTGSRSVAMLCDCRSYNPVLKTLLEISV